MPSISSRNALISENTIKSMTKENGSAAIIIVFCKAVKPLTESKMTAIVDWIKPQMSLTLFGGVNEPFVDCIPRTKVAESADVMKNEAIKIMAATDKMSDHGIASNISKIVSSVLNWLKSILPPIWISIAVEPNAANQNAPRIVGAIRTPTKNSRIVRPLETRAINILTKGAQEIHQAQ